MALFHWKQFVWNEELDWGYLSWVKCFGTSNSNSRKKLSISFLFMGFLKFLCRLNKSSLQYANQWKKKKNETFKLK